MSSVKELMRFLSADTQDSEKHRKKKSKKLKKSKMDKDKLKKKNQQWLKHYTECYESSICTQLPEMKKKKEKKTEVSSNDEFLLPLTQCKDVKQSKPHKKQKNFNCATGTHRIVGIVHPGPAELEAMAATSPETIKNLTQKDKNLNKKRVTFTLSPVLIQPTARDHQPQFSTAKLPSPNPVLSTNRLSNKSCVEENLSQTPSEDINSQDLFITQKSYSEPYIDICSSASVEETDTIPPQQSYRPLSQDKTFITRQNTFEASTQTENFFTSPMPATSLRFNGLSRCTEDPLDLSLPRRFRALHPQLTVMDVNSSDDSDTTAKSKSDLSQVKVVQTRLNESFFFKLKGEVDSPKPRSPLMKLTGSIEKKK